MNSTKMLQVLIDGQAALRKEIGGVRSEAKEGQNSLRNEIKEGFKEVNKRLDSIGKSVAFLEDDAPTRDEQGKLEKRVSKVEKKLHIQTS